MAARCTAPAPLTADQKALRAAIAASPDEDTPRLAYADLLEEIGGESNAARAEFIRLQCGPGGKQAAARARRLLARHRREWEGPVAGEGVEDVEFRRGFVDSVTATAEAFLRAGAAWWDAHPVRHVRLERVRGALDRVAAAPHLDRVRSLWLADGFRGRSLRDLVEVPRPGRAAGTFPALEVLYVGGWTEHDDFFWDGAAALAECHMPRLRDLHLLDLLDDDRAAAAVAAAPWFGGLESLVIHSSRVGDAGLAALVGSPRRKSLHDLSLDYGRVTAAGLHALADLPADPPLRWLSLRASRTWTHDLWRTLAPRWEVDPDRLGDVLRKHPALTLDLDRCPIPEPTWAAVVRRFGGRLARDC